jgi:hypothetical protein
LVEIALFEHKGPAAQKLGGDERMRSRMTNLQRAVSNQMSLKTWHSLGLLDTVRSVRLASSPLLERVQSFLPLGRSNGEGRLCHRDGQCFQQERCC